MWRRSLHFLTFATLLSIGTAVAAQQKPEEISACDLARNPKPFDGKTIRVRAALNVFFEDFTLDHTDCATDQGIWLAFGGDVPGIVSSTVNDNFRKAGVNVQVHGVSYEMRKDESFRRLYALIAARRGDKPEYRVTATLTGAFFAGSEQKMADGKKEFREYGHLGCCALFVITQVSDVESSPPANLDLGGVVLGPNGKPIKGIVVFDDVDGGDPPERQQAITDDRGEFKFSSSGQIIRIQNTQYRPLSLAVEPGTGPVRVRLQDAKLWDWIISYCSDADRAGRIGFLVFFALPKTMTSSTFSTDEGRSFFVFPEGKEDTSAELFISTIPGELTDTPESRDSRWVKDGIGKVVGIDSRWRAFGYYDRSVSFLGHDSVHYGTQSAARRGTFDKIIDSGCVTRH